MCELCFRGVPTIDPAAVLAAVRSAGAEVDLVGTLDDGSSTLLAFPRLTHRFTDGKVVPLLATVIGPTPTDPGSARPYDLSQTWGWDEAGVVIAGTTHTLVVAELMGRVHLPAARLGAYRLVLEAVIDHTRPVGTWWPSSGTALPPLLALERPLAGLVNVRLYQDSDRPGYSVMDTLGLHSFGLPDLQCHFRDLEHGRMASLMYATAEYLVNGAVIETGHTIQGFGSSSRWSVILTGSLVDPPRAVLDLNPGSPHAATS